jgi:hypothetical protein
MSPTTAITAPSATIIGSNTELFYPTGVAADESGKIYVANYGGGEILMFANGASGNTPPVARIKGLATRLNGPTRIALDGDGNMYVANGGPAINVYAHGAKGDVAPIAVISGDRTNLHFLADVTVGP